MTWKLVVRLLILAALQCLWCGFASAQIGPLQPAGCYLYLTANDLGFDLGAPLPPGAVLVFQNTVPGEEGLSVYRVTDPTCPPPAAPSETCSTCGLEKPIGGAPISLVTGDTFIVENDVNIPGLSNGLKLTRTWNSKWPSSQTSFQSGIFGLNWRSTYEERIFVGSDSYVRYGRSDGSFWSFACASWSSCGLVAPANVKATLTVSSNLTAWTLIFQNGEQRVFNYTSGSLTSIIDRNGNTTQLTYDGINLTCSPKSVQS